MMSSNIDFDVDCLVIGAGVVGLAVARSLAMSGREVSVIESEKTIGMGTSSRNSEVIFFHSLLRVNTHKLIIFQSPGPTRRAVLQARKPKGEALC